MKETKAAKAPREKKTPSTGYALLCLVIAFGMIMIASLVFGAKIHSIFYFAWMVAFLMCLPLGYSFQELQTGMFKFMARCLLPMTVCLTVGAMIGTWCASGTLAYVMNICFSFVTPQKYMFITFVICLIFALLTGTSFGTIGTVGVAMMGVGLGLGINPLVIAAPVITAAYIGDGVSPVSGNPNITAGALGIDLFNMCKYQLTMTLPVIIIHMIIYAIWGAKIDVSGYDPSVISGITAEIAANYNLSILCLIPIIVVLVMLIAKFPVIPSLLGGVVSGALVSWFYQGDSLKQVASYIWGGFVMKDASDLVNGIFTRGGITSMQGPAIMFVLAFGLFGIFTTAGVIDAAIKPVLKLVKSRPIAAFASVLLGTFGNATSASGQFTNMFASSLLEPIYEKNDMNFWDLARSIPVGCLYMGLLMPWNSNPATACGFLDVDPIAAIPYMMSLPLVAFVILMFYSITGIDKKFSKFARGEVPAHVKEQA